MAKGIKQLYGYPLIDQTARNDIKNNYQKKTDENLQTTDKTIVGGINEVNTQCKDIAKKTITTEERTKLANLNNYDDTNVKTNIQNVQQQVNNLVLGAVGDGNNAEVVQARGGYSTLNDRINNNELNIKNANDNINNNIIVESYDKITFERLHGEFTTTTYSKDETGYTTIVTALTETAVHSAKISFNLTGKDIYVLKIEYEFLESPVTPFVGIGKTFRWNSMLLKTNIPNKGILLLDPKEIPGYDGSEEIFLFIGSKEKTCAGFKCRFKMEIYRAFNTKLTAYTSRALMKDGSDELINEVLPLSFNNVINNIDTIPIGVKLVPFKDYCVRDNTNDLVKLTDLGNGVINVKKENEDVGINYQGVYIHLSYSKFEDLDGEFIVKVVSNDGKSLPNQNWILYEMKNWSIENGRTKLPINTLFNLKELLDKEELEYKNRNELYFTVLTYSPDGVSQSCDFNVSVSFTRKDQAPVIASSLTTKLKQDLLEMFKNNGTPYITCWGDSLTAMGGWTTTLQTLTGLTVYNGGTGGENSQTIMARQGADVMMVNNITIPATTDPIVIASRNTDKGISTYFGNKVTPLLQGGAHVNPCYIGDVKGTLKWTGESYSDTNGTWTFTRSETGEQIEINRPTAIRTDFDINKNAPKIMIIYMGQNGGYANIEQLVQQHRLMIEHSNCKDFIVLGLSSGTASSRKEYEDAMKNEFGRRFISLREYLSVYGLDDAGITPTEQDTSMMAQGETPKSLLIDSVHYNDKCRTVIANMLYKKIKELNMI